jgi:hypothetical protein
MARFDEVNGMGVFAAIVQARASMPSLLAAFACPGRFLKFWPKITALDNSINLVAIPTCGVSYN